MPKTQPKRFNVEKDFEQGTAVESAPLVGGEFVTDDGEWQGQTINVQSDKHLEDDHGTGEHVIIRTYEFLVNKETFAKHEPTFQELYDTHKNGIESLLWQDGLKIMPEINAKIGFSKDKDKYFIMVTARPMAGQTVIEQSKTLSELIPNESSRHSNTVHGIV